MAECSFRCSTIFGDRGVPGIVEASRSDILRDDTKGCHRQDWRITTLGEAGRLSGVERLSASGGKVVVTARRMMTEVHATGPPMPLTYSLTLSLSLRRVLTCSAGNGGRDLDPDMIGHDPLGNAFSTTAAVCQHATTMNGYTERPTLDEDAFGENKAAKVVQAFDYFPKTKPSYQEKTNSGGVWTIILVCASLWLASTELGRWWKGNTAHAFSVEQGIGRDLQINLDVIVAMKCDDLHVNVQDASGDRILAGSALHKDSTQWARWTTDRKQHKLGANQQDHSGAGEEYREDDVHDYLGAAKGGKKFPKTPKIPRRATADSCRVYGTFNFSHHINELSFGPFYPSLINPLDDTVATTENKFHKFQYYLSVVPTIYTTTPYLLRKIDKYHESPSSGSDGLSQHSLQYSKDAVFTNQYAVTEQSHAVSEHSIPGVFVKFDIEPIMLMITEEWSSWPALFIRLVNVISGILVAGGWLFQITEWAREMYGRKRSRRGSGGMLTPMFGSDDKPNPAPGNHATNYGYPEKRW
nr:endoplasmic reticulum-golgi intermediate compartment protein 2 [Quercus suber]